MLTLSFKFFQYEARRKETKNHVCNIIFETLKPHSLPLSVYPDSLTALSRFCPFKNNQSLLIYYPA